MLRTGIKIGVEGRPHRVKRGRLEFLAFASLLRTITSNVFPRFGTGPRIPRHHVFSAYTKRVTNEHVNVPSRGSSTPLAKQIGQPFSETAFETFLHRPTLTLTNYRPAPNGER